jgi:hypothetical protein
MIAMAKSTAVSEVRAWARSHGYEIGDRGRLPTEVWDAWAAAAPKTSKRASRQDAKPPQPVTPSIDPAELREAQQRINELEVRLDQLSKRMEAVEANAAAQPTAAKRRFARAR